MAGYGKDDFGSRVVTEFDLRAPEFKHPDTRPEDLEFRADGKIVRKDRWQTGMHSIAEAAGFNRREGFEIDDVVNFTEKTFSALEGIEHTFILDVLQRMEKYMNMGSLEASQVQSHLLADIKDAVQVVEQTVLKLAEAAPEDTDTD